MKLRWKHFLVLVSASLIPLLVVTLVSQDASTRLGKKISEKARNTLLENAKEEMVRATGSYANLSLLGGIVYEQAIRGLGARAELALILPAPPAEKLYYAGDFEHQSTAPKDLAPSDKHPVHSKGRPVSYKFISRDHPNFLLAPGTAKETASTHIAKLARLNLSFKKLGQGFTDGLIWVYASLENGVHMAYPGHGGYPKGFDARKRPWYVRAKQSKKAAWSTVMDATTGQPLLTVSMPFKGPDGAMAGVVGMDIKITQALLKSETTARWSKSMVSFIVGEETDPGSGKSEIWVLSSPGAGSEPGLESGFGTVGYRLEIKDFFRLIKNEKSGCLDMPYKGVESLWAYASMFGNQYFVIVVPKSEIMTLPREVGQMVVQYSKDQTAITAAAVVMALIFVGIVAFFTSRHSTSHILAVVDAWKKLAKGDFSVRINTRMNDERDQLIHAFNLIVPKIDEHIRMRNALGLAQEVQQSLLPQTDPFLAGFDIAGASIYCDETGGDYYDFIDTGNGDQKGLSVVIGDVSGHGVSSALLMATARALVMLRSSMPGEAAGIINDVNRHLSRDTAHTGDFMTFFYCELKERENEICWVRAGHDPGLLYTPATDTFDELKGRGPALGLDYTFEYESFSRKIEPGQIIMIGTDGIWEMHNTAGRMFGKEALMDIIRNNRMRSARTIVDTVTDALEKFRGDEPSEDDITLVVIKVT